MAIINPSQYGALGLPDPKTFVPPTNSNQLSPQNAYQGQINSAVGGGQSALAGGQVATDTAPGKIAATNAESNITTTTAPSVIASTNAKSTVDVNQAAQLDYIAKTKDLFDKNKGKDGYVSPQVYNKAKQDASHLNITSDAFDGTFKRNYTNPNNIYYNTDEMAPIRSTVQEVYNLLKDYHNLSIKGPETGHLVDIPGVLGMGIGGDSKTYQNNVTNLASSIRGLVGAGQQSGFRFNLQELNRIGSLMPSIYDTDQQAEQKINQLDQLMKTQYGVGIDDFINADTQSQGASQ